MKYLGIVDLLRLAGLDPTRPAKMARHQDDRYPVQELLRNKWLELYQGYQQQPRFHKFEFLVSFTGLSGQRARFFGVFRKRDVRPASEGPTPRSCPWAKEWQAQCKYFYDFRRVAGFEDLEGRVIIDWGPGALAWHQKLINKPVLQIEPPGRRLPQFDDYLGFSLSFAELEDLIANPDAHGEWRAHLQAVGGVYLILAETTGELYVGSASGAEGIWGRWSEYARTGHGNTQLLRDLITRNPDYPSAFRFSLLQILPKTLARDEIIDWERTYKHKLGTRAHGLNVN